MTNIYKTYKEARSVPINLRLPQTFRYQFRYDLPVAKNDLHAWFEEQNAAVLLDIAEWHKSMHK